MGGYIKYPPTNFPVGPECRAQRRRELSHLEWTPAFSGGAQEALGSRTGQVQGRLNCVRVTSRLPTSPMDAAQDTLQGGGPGASAATVTGPSRAALRGRQAPGGAAQATRAPLSSLEQKAGRVSHTGRAGFSLSAGPASPGRETPLRSIIC